MAISGGKALEGASERKYLLTNCVVKGMNGKSFWR